MTNEISGMRSRFGVCGNPYQSEPTKEERTKAQPRQKPKYTKSAELRQFENEYNAHKYDNSTMPDYARVRTTFTDKTANGLTAAVITHLQFYGHFAARVNTTGVYDAKRGCYRLTNARLGMADISAVINGKPLQIEIKAGKDRPRADQLQVQREYEAAGGVYIFVHTFAEWIEQYNKLTAHE